MKKIIALLILGYTPFTMHAQGADNAKYEAAMLPNVRILDTAIYVTTLEATYYNFKRIADIEKTRWLPYYYMAYCKVRIASAQSDKTVIDTYLDEAKSYCDKIDSLDKDNVEVLALRSRIALSKIPINMIERGPKYSSLAKVFAEAAVTKDPKNARAYISLGMYYLYTPSFFGGDSKKACGNFSIAKKLLKDQPKDPKYLYPTNGEMLVDKLSSDCGN